MYKERYIKRKDELLRDSSINQKNREVIEKFLIFQEYKLKRQNGLAEVDERSYKTLYFYIGRLRNLNRWFNNKSWSELTEAELKKLIDDLEDGNIKTKKGTRYSDRSLYYDMIQGKLFDLVGKGIIAAKILREFSIRGREFKNEVRYITEESFRKLVNNAYTPEQKCLMWLAFDIGENIGTLLELTREDFQRQINPDTNEPEYLVTLAKEKLKRSRTARGESTNYKETVEFLDLVLSNLRPAPTGGPQNNYLNSTKTFAELHPENKLFKFGHKAADRFFKRAANKSGVKCLPKNDTLTWKDLRSSMACNALRRDWSVAEVSARLGHRPSSRVLDKYCTYLALDRRKPKTKVYQSNLKKVETELEQQKETSKLLGLRLENMKQEQEEMKDEIKNLMLKVKSEIKEAIIGISNMQNNIIVRTH